MKRVVLILLFSGILASCNSGEPEETDTILEQTLTDSAKVQIAEEPDTTLQPVVELTLRALGNTEEEIKFDQDTLEVPAGALVNFTLINEGTELTMIHNFVLTTQNKYREVAVAGAKVSSPKNYVPASKHVITATPLALPGQTVQHEFEAPPAGVYSFVCTYPDHWAKMHGTFIVTE